MSPAVLDQRVVSQRLMQTAYRWASTTDPTLCWGAQEFSILVLRRLRNGKDLPQRVTSSQRARGLRDEHVPELLAQLLGEVDRVLGEMAASLLTTAPMLSPSALKVLAR
jgi:hypothetical protein